MKLYFKYQNALVTKVFIFGTSPENNESITNKKAYIYEHIHRR